MKLKNWRKKVTKTELNHLRTVAFPRGTMITRDGLRRTFEGQQKMREAGIEPCPFCRGIAAKLGFAI